MTRISHAHIVPRKLLYVIRDVQHLRTSAGYDNAFPQFVRESAFLYVPEHCIQDFLHPGSDYFRQICHRNLLVCAHVLGLYLDDFLAEIQELLRHAAAECYLDVLRQVFGNAAFVPDVTCHRVSSERNGTVCGKHLLRENADRRGACTQVNECHAVALFFLGQDSLRGGDRCEICAAYRNAQVIENLGHAGNRPLRSDEHLEMSCKFLAGHADDVILDELEIVTCRE